MNDKEALDQINWAMDEYLKDGGTTILVLARIARTLGRNTQWNKLTAS